VEKRVLKHSKPAPKEFPTHNFGQSKIILTPLLNEKNARGDTVGIMAESRTSGPLDLGTAA